MWASKNLVACLCIVGAVGNPVAAAITPCCCVRLEQPKPKCCHSKNDSAKSAEKACCVSRVAKIAPALEACRCCVKSLPQPLNDRPTTAKVAGDLFPALWFAPQPQADSLMLPDCECVEAVHASLTGPPLLALLCKWLK